MPRSRTPHIDPARPGAAPAVTLRQVAEATGFSIATVSCAFNDKGKVSAANRQRILATAEAMGYRPNLLVRAMQSGISGNVGVVIAPFGEFTRDLLTAVCSRLVAAGIMPITHWSKVDWVGGPQAEAEAERAVLDRLLAHRVDGVILAPAYDDVLEYHFAEVWRRGLPLVSIDRTLPRVTCDSVSTDDILGGRLAAEHLLSLGHRHVAQIAGEQRFGSYRRRAESFAATISLGGGTCRTLEALNQDFATGLPDIARRALAEPRPSAIFLGADNFAPPVYAVAAELGLKIPSQISVVGYADLASIRMLQPALTTFAQDPHLIGERAADLLLSQLQGKAKAKAKQPQAIALPPRLIERASTAPCLPARSA